MTELYFLMIFFNIYFNYIQILFNELSLAEKLKENYNFAETYHVLVFKYFIEIESKIKCGFFPQHHRNTPLKQKANREI